MDELLGRKELEALADEHGRALVLAAARAALERAREEVKAGLPAGDLVERTAAEVQARLRPSLRRVLNATGVIVHTNLGRAPLAEAALERVREVGLRLLQPRVRRRGRRPRLAPGSPRRAPPRADRRRVGARRQQQRRGCPAGARRAGRGPRGRRLARGADRDRRRLPHPGHPGPLRRDARRGRDDQSDAPRGLRACGRRGRRVLLRVHQSNFRMVGFTEQPKAATWRASRSATGSRSSTTSARARSSRPGTSRLRAPRSTPAPTSSRSRATSCWAARRRGSWSAAPT